MKKNSSSFIDTVKKFKNDPLYNSAARLGFYFVFFAVFFILFLISGVGNRKNVSKNSSTKKTTTAITTNVVTKDKEDKTYGELLSDIYYSKTNVKINVTKKDGSIYYIEFLFDSDVLTGTYEESNNTIKKFKYADNKLYEINMGKEVVNEELLSKVNTVFLNFRDFFVYFSENNSIQTKNADEVIYTYSDLNINNEVFTKAEVIVKDNKIPKITLENADVSYEYQFEIQQEE